MRARLTSWLLWMAPDSALMPSASAFFCASLAALALSFLLTMTSFGFSTVSAFFGGDGRVVLHLVVSLMSEWLRNERLPFRFAIFQQPLTLRWRLPVAVTKICDLDQGISVKYLIGNKIEFHAALLLFRRPRIAEVRKFHRVGRTFQV
jgi:hypothetical protein